MANSEEKAYLSKEFIQSQLEYIQDKIHRAHTPKEKLTAYLLYFLMIGGDLLTALGFVYIASESTLTDEQS